MNGPLESKVTMKRTQPSSPPGRAQAEMRRTLINWLQEQGETAALDGDRIRTYPRRQMPANPDAGLIYQDHPWANQHIPSYTPSERTIS